MRHEPDICPVPQQSAIAYFRPVQRDFSRNDPKASKPAASRHGQGKSIFLRGLKIIL